MATAMLAIVSASAVYGLTRANWSAAAERNRSAARGFCQERIEEALSATFNPPRYVPATFGTWPISTSETVSSTDTVTLYSEPGAAAQNVVTGTRTCRVALQGTELVRFTARVTWKYRNRDYSYEMCTLRAADTLR